jgi:acid phosphatase type 7
MNARSGSALVALLAAQACRGGVEPAPPQGSAERGAQPFESYRPARCDYEVHAPESVEEATRHGRAPGSEPVPLNVHVSWAGPTASSFAVGWKTGLDTDVSSLLFGTDRRALEKAHGPGPGVELREGHTLRYGSTSTLHSWQATRVHEVHVCGLLPETTYFYKVGAQGHFSPVYDVATGPARGASRPVRFVVAGDSRDDPAVFAQVMEKIDAEAPDFILFTGDAVAFGHNQNDWDAWFGATSGDFPAARVFSRVPIQLVNGNHENLAVNYFAQFALPAERSEGELEPEQWYGFDYANAFFVVLDSQPSGLFEQQRRYLRAALARLDRRSTPWIFAAFHHPPYSCSLHGSDLPLRRAWQPVFDEFKVDVVWTGHDHVYERSVPIRGFSAGPGAEGLEARSAPGKVPIAESGTLYVVAGGAGAPLYPAGRCYHTHVAERTRGYVVVDLDGRRMRYRAMRLDGTEIESFAYAK